MHNRAESKRVRSKHTVEYIKNYKHGTVSVVCTYFEGEVNQNDISTAIRTVLKQKAKKRFANVNINEIRNAIGSVISSINGEIAFQVKHFQQFKPAKLKPIQE